MQLTPTKTTLGLLSLLTSVLSQNVTVPATCTGIFKPGVDEVIYTIPYTYAQTFSIIGSYKNLTWSGNPDNTVTLNGTNNKVGTARSYSLAGANLVETILVYDSPPGGPYYEVHNLALITVPSFNNLQTYAQYDGTNVTSVCGGRASQFNFTAKFCADNVTVATQAYHLLHMMDAQTVGKLLGGANFTSCEALGASNSSSTASASAPVATYPGAAVRQWAVSGWSGVLVAGAMLAAAP